MGILSRFWRTRKPDVVTIERIGDLWQYRCTLPGGRSFTGYDFYDRPVDAANAAAKLVCNNPHAVLKLDNDVRDALIARWQLEGIDAYRQGKPALCWNSYQRQAYQAAQADAQGVLVFGWPTPVGAGA